MLETFIQTLTGPCSVREGQAVLACCSGGVDSMVLLDLLLQAASPLSLKVGAVHVDHGIRGEDSLRDARFVSEHCGRLGIPCHLYRLGMAPGGPNLEERARTARYEKILHCAHAHGYHAAATGHTLNDQAETILYRLIRGSGLRGLAGMDHRSAGVVVRPMLGFTRHQVEACARSRGTPFVEDVTNLDTKHARNLIRARIVPVMEKINPSVLFSIARLGDIAREEGGLVEELSCALEGQAQVADWGGVKAYRVSPLREAPVAVLKRMAIRIVSSLAREPRGIDASQVEEIVKVVRGEKASHTVMRRVTARRDGDVFAFFPAGRGPFYRVDVPAPGFYGLPGLSVGVRVGLRGTQAKPLVLRSAGQGDRIQGKKVVKLLADRGVMRALRPFWPVVEAGGEIVSLAGLLEAEGAAGLTTEFPCTEDAMKG